MSNPPQEFALPDDSKTDAAAHANMVFRLRLNAIFAAVVLVCALLFVFLGSSSTYYSFDTRLFGNFFLCGVSSVLLFLYVLLIGLTTCKSNDRTTARIGQVVSLILTMPLGLTFFVFADFYWIEQTSSESPLAFLLVGIFVISFAAFVVVCLFFYLFNLQLIRFSRRANYWRGIGMFLVRLLLSIFLLGAVLGICYLHLDWREAQHRQCVNEGEYKILTLRAPHELLLLDRSNRFFALDPEKVTLKQIAPQKVAKEFPGIVQELREKDYDSVTALASSWLKEYPGYPDIDYMVVSPDGRWTITTTNQGTSLLMDSTGEFEPIRLYHGLWIASHAFTPDGKYVLVQGNWAHIVLSDVPIKLDRIIVWRVPDKTTKAGKER